MQTQVVHQRKQELPWIPILVAGLLVAATAAGVQVALRDRGTTVTPPAITSVDQGANLQKAGMTEAGVGNLSGSTGATSDGWVDPATAAREGGGVASVGAFEGQISGPHARVKYGAPEGGSAGSRDPALQATITRIEQAR
jgi:hypothetical protein